MPKKKALSKKFEDRLKFIIALQEELKSGKKTYRGLINKIDFINKEIKVTTIDISKSFQLEQVVYTFPEEYICCDDWIECYKKAIEEKREKER